MYALLALLIAGGPQGIRETLDYDPDWRGPRLSERKPGAPDFTELRESLAKEFVSPNGDLKIGHDIAEWDEAPSPSEVKEKIDGKSYEERSGTLLTDDLQVAR